MHATGCFHYGLVFCSSVIMDGFCYLFIIMLFNFWELYAILHFYRTVKYMHPVFMKHSCCFSFLVRVLAMIP